MSKTPIKTSPGNFFEDFRIGQVIRHATPRTVTVGDVALYTGLFSGRLTSIRADVSFRDAAGTRWLIDIAPRPRQSLTEAFGLRLARHSHLAQALDGQGSVQAAIYLPAAQLLWTGEST